MRFLNSSRGDLRSREGYGNGEFSRCPSSVPLGVEVIVNLDRPHSFSLFLILAHTPYDFLKWAG